MPPDKRIWANDQHGSGDRREQSIEPDEEEAIPVREPHPAAPFPPQHDDLLPERSIFRLKSRF